MTALSVVVPTLAGSASFENLSGAYLYAVLAIALPSQVAAIRASRGPGASAGRWLLAIGSAALWIMALTAGARLATV